MSDKLAKAVVIDGVEYPPVTWRCSSCHRGLVSEAFTLPPGWATLKIEVGLDNGLRKQDSRMLCPTCFRAVHVPTAPPQVLAMLPPPPRSKT